MGPQKMMSARPQTMKNSKNSKKKEQASKGKEKTQAIQMREKYEKASLVSCKNCLLMPRKSSRLPRSANKIKLCPGIKNKKSAHR